MFYLTVSKWQHGQRIVTPLDGRVQMLGLGWSAEYGQEMGFRRECRVLKLERAKKSTHIPGTSW